MFSYIGNNPECNITGGKMNVTFLIGNGFDINLGLDTSYSAFYNKLIKKYPNPAKEYDKDNLPMLMKIVNSINDDKSKPTKEKLWSDFEIGLGLFTQKITIDEIDEFNNARLQLKEDLAEYLIEENKKLSLISNKEDLLNAFIYSIFNFALELNPKDKNTISKRQKTQESVSYNVITFNYTNSFETVMKKSDISVPLSIGSHTINNSTYSDTFYKIIHIHGTYDSRMITGLNDKNQIANPELRDNEDLIHTFIKPQINSDCGELVDQEALDLLNRSSIFVVFGMSYGATDKMWWRKICDRMLNDGSAYLILFEISQKCQKIHLENEYKIKNEIRNKFFDGLDLNDDQKKKIAQRILITFNSPKMFKFAEPKKDEQEKKELATV